MRSQTTEIIFIPTWRCNLRCPYCDYRAEQKSHGMVELNSFGKHYTIGPEIPWPLWIAYLYVFKPYHLELTGGEPTLYEGLAKFLDHLPSNCSWAMTSNTLGNVSDFESYNCRAWTASYHFVKESEFLKSIQTLRLKGFTVRVTMVLTPENFKKIEKAVKLFRKEEFPINIHPYLKQGFSWGNHQDIFQKFKEMHDGNWVDFISGIPMEFKGDRYDHCEAGNYYFALWPDGTVYRCLSSILHDGESSKGHIKDFIPGILIEPCNRECMFPCDRERPKKH